MLTENISRRAFLVGTASLTGVAALSLASCAKVERNYVPPTTAPQAKEPQKPTEVFPEQRIREAADQAILGYNEVYKQNVNPSEIQGKLKYLGTFDEYFKTVSAYDPNITSEFLKPTNAITFERDQIFVCGENMLNQINPLFPQTIANRNQAISDFLSYIMSHEIGGHLLSFPYHSEELLNLTLKKFAGLQEVKGYKFDPYSKGAVKGAFIRATRQDGKTLSFFNTCEESEAEIIAFLQSLKKPPKSGIKFPDNMHGMANLAMYNKLLRRVFKGNIENGVRTIEGLRRKDKGREELYNIIGNEIGRGLNVPSSGYLELGMTAFYAIESGNDHELSRLLAVG